MSVTYDDSGLIPAIAQDRLTGEVRMVAFMNAEALALTLSTGLATFFSRSRGKLWVKGESSGNQLEVSAVIADCDADTLLLQVDPVGPSCHTGRRTCFFRRVLQDGSLRDEPTEAQPFLLELERTLEERKSSTAEKSYTKSLFESGAVKIGAKVEEEARELAQALRQESDERVVAEAADVLYHLMVGLRARDLTLRAVIEAMAARTQQSGHEEKAARSPKA
jgi:phosphoribosyl-AMP cyclohydrolase / phosphoribosyl-ATP pyrophosphohydrolase